MPNFVGFESLAPHLEPKTGELLEMTGRHIEADESERRTRNIDVTVKIVSSGESTELTPRSTTNTTLCSSVS